MQSYFTLFLTLLKRILLLLLVFEISRLAFLLFNLDYFSPVGTKELFRVMVYGLHFDLVVIFYFNIIFILMHIIPGKLKYHIRYQKILKILFIAVNAVIFLPQFIDIAYFPFTSKRITASEMDFLNTGNDFLRLLPSYIADFWYVILMYLISVLIVVKLYPRYKGGDSKKLKTKWIAYQSVISVLVLAVIFSFVRGFDVKPFGFHTAVKYVKAKNVPLVTNTPFTVVQTMGKNSINEKNYFTSEKLEELYSPVMQIKPINKKNKCNIVFIILESLSTEYVGYYNDGKGYTPFLDSILSQSLTFKYSFANGRRSIEVLPAIFSSIPALTKTPYIISEFSLNNINSLAKTLRLHGYHSSFFHGGKNGTMNFDFFTEIAGFDQYFGKTEYNNDADFDGKWGIYDGPFFTFFLDKLNNFSQPFLSSVFSLSSHHPYNVPEKYRGKFPKGTLEIHESIGYTDYVLSNFFKDASRQEWFKNTLFIITGDHTSELSNPKYNNRLGKYAVPIAFYHPEDTTLKGFREDIIQHIDLFPSVLSYAGIEGEIVSFGNNVFDTITQNFAVNYNGGIYQYIEDRNLLMFDGNKANSFYNFFDDPRLEIDLIEDKTAKVKQMENKIKALIQQFNYRVINNKLVIDK